MTPPPGAGPFWAGLRGCCPGCGRGPLFAGFLAVTPICLACGRDLAASDSGDGPAVFVILIVGFVGVFAALLAEIAVHPPIWVHLVLWLPLGAALCLVLLRPVKGLMIAAQVRNRPAEPPTDEGA